MIEVLEGEGPVSLNGCQFGLLAAIDGGDMAVSLLRGIDHLPHHMRLIVLERGAPLLTIARDRAIHLPIVADLRTVFAITEEPERCTPTAVATSSLLAPERACAAWRDTIGVTAIADALARRSAPVAKSILELASLDYKHAAEAAEATEILAQRQELALSQAVRNVAGLVDRSPLPGGVIVAHTTATNVRVADDLQIRLREFREAVRSAPHLRAQSQAARARAHAAIGMYAVELLRATGLQASDPSLPAHFREFAHFADFTTP
ncbi:MAG: hypothetical protein IPJ56_02625 [Gemmatimonadetes bacterium]|nr:hypothetical protein [Gemmatimonadota bacterium]